MFFFFFNIFAQNIDCGYMLELLQSREVVLMSTHNLPFESKIRNIGIPLQTPVFYIKVGLKKVYISQTCFPDVAE